MLVARETTPTSRTRAALLDLHASRAGAMVGRQAGRPLSNDAGVTLLELIVVLMIVAAGAVLVVPSIRAGSQQREVRLAVQRFVRAVRASSSSAIRSREPVTLSVWPDDGSFSVDSQDRVVDLPAFGAFSEIEGGLYLDDEGRDRVVFQFYPTGGCSGGAVEMEFDTRSGRQSYVLTMNPLLSTVFIEESR